MKYSKKYQNTECSWNFYLGLNLNNMHTNWSKFRIPPFFHRAMLSVVITVVFFVCYCCHRNIKKQSGSAYRQQWLEQEANMEIYSVEQVWLSNLSFAVNRCKTLNNSNLFDWWRKQLFAEHSCWTLLDFTLVFVTCLIVKSHCTVIIRSFLSEHREEQKLARG